VAPGVFSETTLIPFERVVELNGLIYFKASGISPNGKSPKFAKTGAFEN